MCLIACQCMLVTTPVIGGAMPRRSRLKRRAFFVDEGALRRARKALGVGTDAAVVRLSVERIAEMEEFWQFMKKSRRILRPGSIETP